MFSLPLQAVIDVNTKGVEAAAATAISIVPKIGNFPVIYPKSELS